MWRATMAELLKLGFKVAQSSVVKCKIPFIDAENLFRRPGPPHPM